MEACDFFYGNLLQNIQLLFCSYTKAKICLFIAWNCEVKSIENSWQDLVICKKKQFRLFRRQNCKATSVGQKLYFLCQCQHITQMDIDGIIAGVCRWRDGGKRDGGMEGREIEAELCRERDWEREGDLGKASLETAYIHVVTHLAHSLSYNPAQARPMLP